MTMQLCLLMSSVIVAIFNVARQKRAVAMFFTGISIILFAINLFTLLVSVIMDF